MRFSIVIPVIKTEYLAECLSSVLEQTYRDYEVLVVDDCSPGPVRSIIENFAHPKLHYLRTPRNLGRADPSMTWNYAIQHAKGEYVTLLGDDDRLSLNYLEEMDRSIHEHPGSNIFRCRLVLIGAKGEVQRIGLPLPELETWDEYLYIRYAYLREQSTAEMCAKAESLRELGGYIPMPMALGSDDLTWISLCLHTPMVSTNRAFAYWRRHEQSVSCSANGAPELNQWMRMLHSRLIELIKGNQSNMIEERLLIASVNDRLAGYLNQADSGNCNGTLANNIKRGLSVLTSMIIPSFFEVRLKRAYHSLRTRRT